MAEKPSLREPKDLESSNNYIPQAEFCSSAGLPEACILASETHQPLNSPKGFFLYINRYVLRSTFVGALGGLLFGFDTAVISGATAGITRSYSLSESQLGLTVSMALFGTVIGALSAGFFGQRYGSREMLRFTAILYLISAIGCAFTPDWSLLLTARFLGGLGIGGSSVLGPVYITELAPANLRGRLVGTFQVNIVIGILFAYLSNYLFSLVHLGSREWRFELGVAALPAAIFFAMLFAIPKSARWLATQGREDEALGVLKLIGAPNPEIELTSILDSLHLEQNRLFESLFAIRNGRLRYSKPIFLAVAIGAFNQLSGINAILYYLNDIFAAAGFSRVSGNLQAVSIGAMNLVATLLGMALIDRIGRKLLLLIGAIGTAICLGLVAFIFFTDQHQWMLVWALVAYIAFFAVSQGAVIWVYISEVFPHPCEEKARA